MTRMLLGCLLLASLLYGGSPAKAAPATGSRQFLQVKEWDGFYTIKRRNAMLPASADDEQWTDNETIAVHIHLVYEEGDADYGHWKGTAVGSATADFLQKGKRVGNGVGIFEVSHGHNGSGTIHSEDSSDAVYLDINCEEGTYIWGTSMGGYSVSGFSSAWPDEWGVPQPLKGSPAQFFTTEPGSGGSGGGGTLPSQVQTLQGSEIQHSDSNSEYLEELRWSLTPVLEPIELIVEPVSYQDWIPNASASEEKAGDRPLSIKARLQKRGGGEPPRPATSIRFEMVHCSAEPGICNNYPGTAKDRPVADGVRFMGQGVPTIKQAAQPAQLDLRFILSANPSMVFPDPSSCATTERPAGYTEAAAVLSSFDWGAYGSLMVTAEVPGYGQVVGHLEGNNDQMLIPIPLRSDNSLIADAWKEREGVNGLPDQDDSEEKPVALEAVGGHLGDGLTLYEEYRGFYENGKHIRGNPKMKDVFLVDAINTPRSRDAVALFKALSRLAVHSKLQDLETESNDELNFNTSGATPKLATKYAIRLRLDPSMKGAAYGVGEVGQPKEVQIGGNWNEGPGGWARIRTGRWLILSDLYAAAVAHEIMHTCSVNHHGDKDLGYEGWAEVGGQIFGTPLHQGDDGQFAATAAERPLTVTNEAGQPLTLAEALAITRGTWIVWVGCEGGQHSGTEDCVMRYDVARAYQPAGQPNHRVVVPSELTGVGLCESPAGTGVNQVGRRPQPRYGDATEGRCRGQICVNDAISHSRNQP